MQTLSKNDVFQFSPTCGGPYVDIILSNTYIHIKTIFNIHEINYSKIYIDTQHSFLANNS